MAYSTTGRYGGFFRVLRYNVGGYGIPPTQNLSSDCVGMAGCHTLLHKFQNSQLNNSTPQHLNTYLLAAWVWQDAIPSYISFTPHHLNIT